MKENGAKLVSSAILGFDGQPKVINGKMYIIPPPTIKRLAGMGYYLADYGGEKTIADYFAKMKDMSKLAKAVSWLIQGDESLEEELQEGTLADLTEAIEIGVGLMGVENFPRLSRSGKSVQTMIAKQR